MDSEKWNKLDLFVGYEKDPLKKYNFFNIEFDKCNYIFIIPEIYSNLFSSFYNKILKESLIFFPKDCSQALDLLNDYEIEADIKENFIIICPCIELENNIQMFQNNKNVYNIIGYCPIFYHIHNKRFLHSFSKYYGIVDSCDE